MRVGRGPEEKESERSAAYDAVGFGMTFAASALLFFAAGVWVDGRFGTSPLFAFSGLVVGGGAGFWWMYTRLTAKGAPSDGGSDPSSNGIDG